MTILKTAATETNFPLDRVYQAVVAQKMDSAIHRINHFPVNKYLEN